MLKQKILIMPVILITMLLFVQTSAKKVYGYTPNEALKTLQEDINAAVARIRPSVISVYAQKKQNNNANNKNDFLWYESIGAEFVIDEKGHVLTNYHVIEGGKNIKVSLWRSQLNDIPAEIVDVDKSLDLAVLKIRSNERFQPAPFGNADTLETGDWVICVGSPFGFKHSVSFGIVSDLHRRMNIGGVTYKDMIQTDAVINQGNSGGPLIDINGNVIGVGTAIYAPDGTYVGLGFAIPINRAIHFFSRVTGASVTKTGVTNVIPAGFTLAKALPANAKEPVNLNKKPPGDAIHSKFSNCLDCHTITQKMVVSKKADMPHPPVAACEECHIMTNDKVAKGPVTVAATRSIRSIPLESLTYTELLNKIILKLVLIILVSSVVFSMLGVGGGFVYVPILLSCGIDFHTATTTSLIMLTLAQFSALYIFFRSGYVDVKLVAILELPTMIGAFLGGMLAHYFNVNLLSLMFACILFLASYFMMQDKKVLAGSMNSIGVSPFEWSHEFRGNQVRIDLMLAMPITFMVGYMGGMLGVAGGWLKVPIMVMMFNIPMKVAIATSALMVPITGFSGFIGHSMAGHFDPRLALSLSVVSIIGGQIGSRLSIETESNILRFIFAFVLSVVGLWMIIRVF